MEQHAVFEPTAPAGFAGETSASWLRGGVRAGLAALLALPVWLATYPPLYDYYQWVFQGRVFAALLPGSPAARPDLAALYNLRWVPVPNLSALFGIGLPSIFLDATVAGRLYVFACALGFGAGYLFLVRTVQRRPSALELLAIPWGYGYLVYKGYLSSLSGIALAFAAIAYLHRTAEDLDGGIRRKQQVALAALGVACYLLHLVGWLVFASALAAYALWLWVDGRRRDGRRLVETTLPTLLLLGWYSLDRAGGVGLDFYSSILDKATSLYEGLLLFVRTDPLPPPFPLFWANVLAGLLLLVLVWFNLDRARPQATPLMATGGLLIAVAMLIPLHSFGDMGRPDERFLLPGLLLVVAGLEHRGHSMRRWLVAAGIVGCILVAHVYEYARASAHLERIEVASEAVIPPGTQVASYTVWGTRSGGGCFPESVPSIGESSLKWFGLHRQLVTGGSGSRLLETSIVHSRLGRHGLHELLVELIDPFEPILGVPASTSMVQFFGCEDEIDWAARSLLPRFSVVETGPGFMILRRNPPPIS